MYDTLAHGPKEGVVAVIKSIEQIAREQERLNTALIGATPCVGDRFESRVLPFHVDIDRGELSAEQSNVLAALEKHAAAVAIKSLASLAKVGDIDHLGGGLELIPSLLMTLGVVDYERRHFTIEHAHTSIGYYAALAVLGFLPAERVINGFRRSLDIAGHVSWVPGGTELSGGRLGVMIPVAAGQSLGVRAHKGSGSLVICHCGDAGWVSGQALNGFVASSLHRAPVIFVMHRNGIQLSAPTAKINPKDPRPIIESLGVRILEIPTLHDRANLLRAYSEAYRITQSGQPVLIYPAGFRSNQSSRVTIRTFGEMYGIMAQVDRFAAQHQVPLDTEIWIPGSLMSFRDDHAMLQCLFYVNGLPGGEGHHDGGMKGRDEAAVLANPMLQLSAEEISALDKMSRQPPRLVVTTARPAKGTPNLLLTQADVAQVQLPGTDKPATPRIGSEAAYVAIAKKHADRCFFVSCDLDPSTRVGKAASLVRSDHRFEMSIQEQVAALLNDGLSFSGRAPQLNVFATFGAFFEGIAREAFEMWRYQRNLTGVNDGLNVVMHLSHVGACTGRDHFSGWSLDWVNLAIGYLPYLRRFYAPADARAAFIAVRDAAGGYGGHIVGIPRDNLPVLTKQNSTEPLWAAADEWTAVTPFRKFEGATSAILSLGAPAYVAEKAAIRAKEAGLPTDVFIVNGLPIPMPFWRDLTGRYRRILTIEDGLIGTIESGLRGFAAHVASQLYGSGVELYHFGITDPRVAPSDHFGKVWEHFQMTDDAMLHCLLGR
jgi:transketolase N-terminal domain/subunit/transketolase C-terminal domain/subunit